MLDFYQRLLERPSLDIWGFLKFLFIYNHILVPASYMRIWFKIFGFVCET